MRFSFGKNWAGYSKQISAETVSASISHIKSLLQVDNLDNSTFLDVGSGSGLSSLAASRLGADVMAFDYDEDSVACTRSIQNQFDSATWPVKQGSVLDKQFMQSLGEYDYVYSWGVLHHTGDLDLAMNNILIPLKEKGVLYLALYNDQGWISKYWYLVKYLYNQNDLLRFLMIFLHSPYLYFMRIAYRKYIKREPLERGMHLWFDMLDWLGGYPFEVITPEKVIDFYRQHGLVLKHSVLCGNKHGCNEFVFQKQ